jgi:hypothetical protein
LPCAEKQILALHAGSAGPRADQHAEIAILERDHGVAAGAHFIEGWEGAVIQLHHDALHRRRRRRYFQQIQIDRLIGAQHLTRRDAKGERVTDISGRAGDGDGDWFLHDKLPGAKGRNGSRNHRNSVALWRVRRGAG